VFGVVFLAALLALAVAIPNPTGPQFEMFRIILALAAGGVAAVIPGLLDIRLGLGSQLALRAGGALAVFSIVYFYSPARWVTETTTASSVSVGTGIANNKGTQNFQAPVNIGGTPSGAEAK